MTHLVDDLGFFFEDQLHFLVCNPGSSTTLGETVMNAETIDVVDCLVEELAVPVIIQLTKANHELRRDHPMGKFDWKNSVDMDVVLMNFPFLW